LSTPLSTLEVPMIPTLLHHESSCSNPKPPVRDAAFDGVVVWRCPGCDALASSPRGV
jgi:hypothetical protein